MPILSLALVTALAGGCGGRPRPQRAFPAGDAIVSVGSREGLTVVQSRPSSPAASAAAAADWSHELPGELLPYGDGGLGLDGDLVVVRIAAAEGTRVAALERSTGLPRWLGPPWTGAVEHAPPLPLAVGPTRVLDLAYEPAGVRALLYDRATGARLADVALDPGLVVKRVAVLGDGFVVVGASRAQVLRVDGSLSQAVSTRGDLCIEGSSARGLGRRGLVTLHEREESDEVPVADLAGSVVACGRTVAGTFVFLVDHAADARWEVVLWAPEVGVLSRFGGEGNLDEPALLRVVALGSDASPWRGRLPAAVPLIVADAQGSRPIRVNLEARRAEPLADAHPRWKLAGITRLGEGHALVVGRWVLGLDGAGVVRQSIRIDRGVVGPPVSDGSSLAWVDGDGKIGAVRGPRLTARPGTDATAALDEALRELGLNAEKPVPAD